VNPNRQAQAGAITTGPTAAPECRTCGAATELEPVTSRSLADGTERTEWFCADASACSDRRFPGLAELLSTGWPAVAETPQPEAGP
jgi:hypothetical protein